MIYTNMAIFNFIAWSELLCVTRPKIYLSKFARGLDRKMLNLTKLLLSVYWAILWFLIENAIYIVVWSLNWLGERCMSHE